MINFLINYWYLIIVAIAVITISGVFIVDFSKKSREEKIEIIKEWAVYACAVAQATLGSGTGQLKMRKTYDMFVSRFPDLARLFPYETYKTIAEMALIEFKKMLETNPNVKDLIIEKGEQIYGNIQDTNQ